VFLIFDFITIPNLNDLFEFYANICIIYLIFGYFPI